MRLAPGFRFYIRIFHYVGDRRTIDAGTADHGLACLADPAVIFRVSRDLFVLAHVSASLVTSLSLHTFSHFPKVLLSAVSTRSQFLPATSCPCFLSKASAEAGDCDETKAAASNKTALAAANSVLKFVVFIFSSVFSHV
jgi:hypothetical protein